MIKEYTQDPKKVEEIYEGRRKKYEKFKEKKPVRRILYLILVIVPLLSALFVYCSRESLKIKNNNELFLNVFMIVLTELFFIGTPIIIYCKMSLTKTEVPPLYKHRETLVLYEDRIINSFGFVGDDSKEMYMVNEIKYPDIKSLKYDDYLECFIICGVVVQTVYDNEYKKNIYSKKTIKKECLDFYLYYNNNDDFMKTVKERSGVLISVVDRNRID